MILLEDILIYQNIMESIAERFEGTDDPGHLITEIGRYFQGAPYVGGPLEQDGPEDLLVNLRGFDCFTYVETCLALACHIASRRHTWQDFTALLGQIRYRSGSLNGYASRLHYFSDWLHDNVQKGFLRDMTPELGGIPDTRRVHYMTEHADLYPALSDPAVGKEMAGVEKALQDHPRYLIPLSTLAHQEGLIRDGDIIGIAAATEGLDVLHAGLAVRRGQVLHLLHASQQAGQVIVSPESLDAYLRQSNSRMGILVGRVNIATLFH